MTKSSVLRVLGIVWTLPLTLLTLMYVATFQLLGWYKFASKTDNALVWHVDSSKSPSWLVNAWRGWAGHTFGNVVVLLPSQSPEADKKTLLHELEHVRQCMTLGPFIMIAYPMFWLFIKLACPHLDSYASNPFEIDARRGAVAGTPAYAVVQQFISKRKNA